MKKPTICVNCKYYKFLDDLPNARYLKYEEELHICLAGAKQKTDYITGNIIKKFDYCRDKNLDGNCLDYQPKENS